MTGSVTGFNALERSAAAPLLKAACASERWITALVSGRPYAGFDALAAASDRAIQALGWPDILQALAAHPRIGDRATGTDVESSFSRSEQSTASSASESLKDQLRAVNLAYQNRFGFVFLICATGKSIEQILAAATGRLDNRPEVEQEVVRGELGQIVRLRLAKLFVE